MQAQTAYPLAFEREMGCTEAELCRWLPGASRGRSIERRERGADITLGVGQVSIDWQQREPRRIALMVIPRLQVRFSTRGVADAEWQQFMRYFDLYTQRGGG